MLLISAAVNLASNEGAASVCVFATGALVTMGEPELVSSDCWAGAGIVSAIGFAFRESRIAASLADLLGQRRGLVAEITVACRGQPAVAERTAILGNDRLDDLLGVDAAARSDLIRQRVPVD